MTYIQRFESRPQEWPMEANDGDLVLYEDHSNIVKALEAKLDKAVDALQYYAFEDVYGIGPARSLLAKLEKTE